MMSCTGVSDHGVPVQSQPAGSVQVKLRGVERVSEQKSPRRSASTPLAGLVTRIRAALDLVRAVERVIEPEAMTQLVAGRVVRPIDEIAVEPDAAL
jgi:hypothetical protein